MKIIKYLFFILLIVTIGGALYFGTQDGTYDLTESKTINAPTSLVFEKVNELRNWKQWGPWKEQDPNMIFTYPENTAGAGGSYSWEGNTIGTVRTISSSPNSEIIQEFSIETSRGIRNMNVKWNFVETHNGTQVSWQMGGEHTLLDKVYFWMNSTDFNNNIKQMQLAGLDGISNTVIDDMASYNIEVTGISEHGGGYYLYVTTASQASQLTQKMAEMFGQITHYMGQHNIRPSGMPFTIYHQTDAVTGSMVLSAGMPVNELIDVVEGSNVACGFMERTSAVKTILKGNYQNLPEAYEKAEAYITRNHLIKNPDRQIFEIYANDPGEYPNPADWLTEIYIPVFNDLRSNHPIITESK